MTVIGKNLPQSPPQLLPCSKSAENDKVFLFAVNDRIDEISH
jgi:hypothetical protein